MPPVAMMKLPAYRTIVTDHDKPGCRRPQGTWIFALYAIPGVLALLTAARARRGSLSAPLDYPTLDYAVA